MYIKVKANVCTICTGTVLEHSCLSYVPVNICFDEVAKAGALLLTFKRLFLTRSVEPIMFLPENY